ncbi:hypothetical protein BDAP_002397 [Binucleata daphniae]
MEKRFQLYITFNKPFFVHNDLITGAVHLKTMDPINLERINLTITKKYNSYLEQYFDDGIQQHNESLDVYKHNFTLFDSINEYTKISSGHHTFPFQFYLKCNDNATTNLSQKFTLCYCEIKNRYVLESNVMVYGIYMPAIHTAKDIPVIDQTIPEDKTVVKIDLSTCFCMINTSFNLTCELDKECYTAGDYANLLFGSKNSNMIVSVNVYLYQIVSIYISKKFKTMSCMILQSKNNNTEQKFNISCKLKLPYNLTSSVKEEKFEVKYVLQIFITIDKGNPIRLKKNININQMFVDNDEISTLNVLQGNDNLPKHFNLN